jgi:hypothetical protein
MSLKPLELEGCVREGPLSDTHPETPRDLGWVSDIWFARGEGPRYRSRAALRVARISRTASQKPMLSERLSRPD